MAHAVHQPSAYDRGVHAVQLHVSSHAQDLHAVWSAAAALQACFPPHMPPYCMIADSRLQLRRTPLPRSNFRHVGAVTSASPAHLAADLQQVYSPPEAAALGRPRGRLQGRVAALTQHALTHQGPMLIHEVLSFDMLTHQGPVPSQGLLSHRHVLSHAGAAGPAGGLPMLGSSRCWTAQPLEEPQTPGLLAPGPVSAIERSSDLAITAAAGWVMSSFGAVPGCVRNF